MTSNTVNALVAQHKARFGQKSGAAGAGTTQAPRQANRGRAWRRLALAAAALTLAACSTFTTGYNNAPTLITWWADSYLDLDGDQETLLKERLRSLRAWHRTQLPDYARLFSEVQVRLKGTVQPADVAWLYDEGEKRLKRIAEHAAPHAAELATHLRADNIAALEKKFGKSNADYEKDNIRAPLQERQEKRFERILKESERWYGGFSSEQEVKIRALSDALPADYSLVLEDRKRRQAELVAILKAAAEKRAPQDEIARRLHRWAADYERGRSPAFRDFVAQYRSEAQKMFAVIANLATEEQRQHAARHVQRYHDDFRSLAVASN